MLGILEMEVDAEGGTHVWIRQQNPSNTSGLLARQTVSLKMFRFRMVPYSFFPQVTQDNLQWENDSLVVRRRVGELEIYM